VKGNVMARSLSSGRWRVCAVVVLVVLLGAVGLRGSSSTAQLGAQGDASPTPTLPPVPPETAQSAGNWPVPQGDLAATRNAANSSITATNVTQLEVAWTFDVTAAGDFGSITANPIVTGDTVYLQDMQSNIFALDRTTGALKWTKAYQVGSIGPNGVTVGYGMVYAALSDTSEVVGLTADSGQEVWRQTIGSPPSEGIDMAPIAFGGLVYVSTLNEAGAGRGVLSALDARTGEVAWRFDTTKGAFGVPRVAGGGGLWYPPSFDDQGNLYFGVANPRPYPLTPACPNGACRPGDNEYTSSMVSLDGTTGAVRWYYQDRKHDILDHDFQHTPILTTVKIGGTDTKLAIGAGKTGNVVAVNADTGAVLWKRPVGKHQNDDVTSLPTDGYLEIYPGTFGGVESPLAYANGTVFAPYIDLPQYQGATGADPDRSANFAEGTGGLVAINAADGSVMWEAKIPTLVLGGATVANDVVFTGGLDGVFRAFDVKSGQEVWHYEAQSGFNAPPAVAGDMVFAGAGFVKLPPAPAASASPVTGATTGPEETPAAVAAASPVVSKLIAFRIGGAAATSGAQAAASPTVTPQPTAAEAATPVASVGQGEAVAMVDIAFAPNALTIPATTDVTIPLTNNGAAIHNFVIDELRVHSGDYQPRQTGAVTINAAPGDYRYYCSIPGHKEAGMVGTLHVQ
jgi:glucose dehydrogenase/plastocyanin